jgi:heme/copper-type cytochrome/quinol oxidase subunit 4
MLQTDYNNILFRAKNRVNENWGLLLITVFILILTIVAALLSLRVQFLADNMVVYAFNVLVLGVVLQFVCFLNCRKKSEVKAF